jgi:hypothetical protein
VAAAGVTYARTFFDLQLRFAETVASFSGLPLAQALLAYTNLYVRLGLGRDFDPAHPGWREYLAGLTSADDRGEWTYRCYVTRPPGRDAPTVVATFGCFAYAWLGEDRIRLHFRNAEPDGRSPLGIERQGQRRADLAALLEHVKRNGPQPRSVVGASWLYNLESYRRLFPLAYLATAHVIHGRFQHMPLWGQFLDRRGELRAPSTRRLLERLGRQTSLETLDDCFPLQVLRLEAPVREFYDFYGVTPGAA